MIRGAENEHQWNDGRLPGSVEDSHRSADTSQELRLLIAGWRLNAIVVMTRVEDELMRKPAIELDVEALPGLKQGVSPASNFRDEWVVSPTGRYFALAYTIIEASMMNEVGHNVWGRIDHGCGEVIGTTWVGACCWGSPRASWINDETFVFKAQYHNGTRTHLPLVAVRIDGSFAVIRESNNLWSRPADVKFCPRRLHVLTKPRFLRAIAAS